MPGERRKNAEPISKNAALEFIFINSKFILQLLSPVCLLITRFLLFLCAWPTAPPILRI